MFEHRLELRSEAHHVEARGLRQTLDEELGSFDSHFDTGATHGAAPIHHKEKLP